MKDKKSKKTPNEFRKTLTLVSPELVKAWETKNLRPGETVDGLCTTYEDCEKAIVVRRHKWGIGLSVSILLSAALVVISSAIHLLMLFGFSIIMLLFITIFSISLFPDGLMEFIDKRNLKMRADCKVPLERFRHDANTLLEPPVMIDVQHGRATLLTFGMSKETAIARLRLMIGNHLIAKRDFDVLRKLESRYLDQILAQGNALKVQELELENAWATVMAFDIFRSSDKKTLFHNVAVMRGLKHPGEQETLAE